MIPRSPRRPVLGIHRAAALLLLLLLLLALGAPLHAQRVRKPVSPVVSEVITRAAIDSFVVTVRDMAAWALVTPAAHIPVGGLQDTTGYVQAIVDGAPPGAALPMDTVLAQFRLALGKAARRTKATAIGLGYFMKRTPPGSDREAETVAVEVEHRSGYRANVFFPYTRDQEGKPVFGEPFTLPGTLQSMARGR